MRKMNYLKGIFISVFMCLFGLIVTGQTMPPVMDTGSIVEQKAYLEERMNIYNGFRAVRDDIFLKLLRNNLDSLNQAKQNILDLNSNLQNRNDEISRLNAELEDTQSQLAEAIKNRDSLKFFGIQMSKAMYNMILWGIILALLVVLISGTVMFNRNRVKTQETKKDLQETMTEFEEFRKTSREKNEQMVINHFNELKKLKEGRS